MTQQRPRIVIAQQQRLALNTSLQASIRLLRSDTAGLTRYLEEQAAENPHIRLIPPEPPGPGDWLPRWSGVLAVGSRSGMPDDSIASAQPSLIAHVLGAIDAMNLPVKDQGIALALVEALEPSGWLGRPPAEIAKSLNQPPKRVEEVLSRLQTIDPPGLFARNLADCLGLQAKDQGKLDKEMAVLLNHLDLLASGDTDRLAKLCGCDVAGVLQRFRTIRTLNPKPGADFASADPAHLREPDLIAQPMADGGWQVSLNRSALPALEVRASPDLDKPRSAAADPKALTAAKALRYMLQARNDTLLQVGREIAARQFAALSEGRGALRPMTMAEVAEAVGVHVSTVSRVVAGTSMDSPRGTWWLRRMFSGGRGNTDPSQPRPAVAAAALRQRLAQIIGAENPAKPLTDKALAAALADTTGVQLARRTVAQYREAEGIPAAPGRKRRSFRPV